MIDVTFNRGTGKGAGAIGYCLASQSRLVDADNKPMLDADGKEQWVSREPLPVVVRGEPQDVERVIDSLDFKHKYISGALSWEAGEVVSPEKEQEIIDEWQAHFLPGLEEDSYAITWIRHEHAGHHELHYVMARCDLETGKSLNPKPPAAYSNYEFTNSWTRLINIKHGWSDPNDPASKADFKVGSEEEIRAGLVDGDKEMMKALVAQRVVGGLIDDGAGVRNAFEEMGLQVVRHGTDYISIKNPEPLNAEGKKNRNIRFKGATYGKGFKVDALNCGAEIGGQGSYLKPDQAELGKLESRVEELRNKREEFFSGRYRNGESLEHREAQRAEHKGAYSFEKTDAGEGELGQEREPNPVEAKRGTDAGVGEFSREAGDVDPSILESSSPTGHRNVDIGGGNLGSEEGVRPTSPDSADQQAGGRRKVLTIEAISQAILEALHDAIRAAVNGFMRIFGITTQDGNAAFAATSRGLGAAATTARRTGARLEQSAGRIDAVVATGAPRMIENRADELDKFKSEINLVEYASTLGFQVDEKRSSEASITIVGNNTKLILTVAQDGHWTYFDVNDDNNKGSIIDLVQKKKGLNLGQVRKELRSFTGAEITYAKPKPISHDYAQVHHAFAKVKAVDNHAYLAGRGIDEDVLKDPRFSGAVGRDPRGNVVFPHWNKDKILTGYELKNQGFTGFSRGGRKGLWMSNNLDSSSKVYVVESGIDALSLAKIKRDEPSAAFISTGGALSPKQVEELGEVARGKDVVCAFDNDHAGQAMAAQVKAVMQADVEKPYNKDWNDDLQQFHNQGEMKPTWA